MLKDPVLTQTGGSTVFEGDCASSLTQDHTRRFWVDYTNKSGSPAVFMVADTSTNGYVWRMVSGDGNNITIIPGKGFQIDAPTGSSMMLNVVYPTQWKGSQLLIHRRYGYK